MSKAVTSPLVAALLISAACMGRLPRAAPGAPVPAPYASASSRRLTVGQQPSAVAIADVNGDGRADLLVANYSNGTVSVLLGDGSGGFREAPGSPVAAGPSPNDICVADFNGDGRLDLAVANHEHQTLTVLFGNGEGGFRPAPGSPVTVTSRPHTHGVAAGDFNGDGKLDLVTDSWAEDKVTVVFGDGRGGFGSPGVQFAVGKRPYQRLRAADLDGDGHPDIVTTNLEGASVTVLLGDGAGGFQPAAGSPFPTGPNPFGVAIGDLDGDGKLDLAVANWSGHSAQEPDDGVSILLGDGRGGFQPAAGSPLAAGRGPCSVAIGDVDGDGIADVVVANYGAGTVTVFLGAGRGAFRPGVVIPVGREPRAVAVGDLNGDGKADIVVANAGEDNVSVLFSP